MRRVYRGSGAAAVCWLLVLTGCSTVPVEEVRFYTQAFDEARLAGNRLYSEIGPVVARAEAAPSAQPGPQVGVFAPAAMEIDGDAACPDPSVSTPYPGCFDPHEFLPGAVPGEPESIAARRRALDTIATYNVVALRLASGETGEAVGAEVRRLAASASALAALTTGAGAALLPIAGPVGDAAAKLAAWAETLRSERQLRQAITAGAPVVHGLIDALIADTTLMYALKRADVAKQLTTLVADAQRTSLTATNRASRHARPRGAAEERLVQIDQRFAGARARLGGMPFASLVAASGTDGAEPFDGAALRELEQLTARIEAIAEEHDSAVRDLTQLHAALGEYVRMLHATGEALDEVTAALAAPRTVAVSPVALAARAVEVRNQAQQVRRALREL